MRPKRSENPRAVRQQSTKPTPLIRLDGVDVSLAGKRVLTNIHWQLQPGEHWVFLGPNGSGKSTLLKLIRGDLWPDAPTVERRNYFFENEGQSSPIGVREKIAFVSPEQQERYWQSDWALTVRETICTGFFQSDLLYQRANAGQKKRARQIAQRLGIESLLARGLHELSAGELRKILIARALVGEPRVLALDEFCDGLDAASRRDLLAMLDAVARSGTQLLYTTHRRDELVPATTHVAELSGGKLAASGTREEIRSQLNVFVGSISQVERSVACHSALALDRGQHNFKRRKKMAVQARFFLRVEKANVFLGRRKILADLNWEMRHDENWIVAGRNGAGKSTLLKLISGELQPAWGGRVIRFGDGNAITIQRFRKLTGWVSPEFQSGYGENLTGAQVVASGFFASVGLMDRPQRSQRARVRELLHRLGMDSLAAKPFLKMSYGERRKILLARAIVHQPRLLILDEPFDGLDMAARAEFSDLLAALMRDDMRVLLVTHHLEDVPSGLTHALALGSGRILFQGELSDARVRHELKWLFPKS